LAWAMQVVRLIAESVTFATTLMSLT
jgi:hypothetical protein